MLTDRQLDSIFMMQYIRARIMRHWAPADQVGGIIYSNKETEAGRPTTTYFDEEARRRGVTVAALKATVIAKAAILVTVLQKADYIYEDYKDRVENEDNAAFIAWQATLPAWKADLAAAQQVVASLFPDENDPPLTPAEEKALLDAETDVQVLLDAQIYSAYPPLVDQMEAELQQIVVDHG